MQKKFRIEERKDFKMLNKMKSRLLSGKKIILLVSLILLPVLAFAQYTGGSYDGYSMNVGYPDGSISGIVTDASSGESIKGATITAIGCFISEPYCVTTNDTGYYEINPIIAQPYNFMCEVEGFITFTDTFTIFPGETYVENVSMYNPEIRVEPDSYVITLVPETRTTRTITVYNDGDTPLEWDSSIEQVGIDLLTNRFEGVTAPSMNAEVNPNQTTLYNPNPLTKGLWDILFVYDVQTPTGLTGWVSAETDGRYLYSTKWNVGSNQIAKYDLEGNFIGIFSIPGVTSLKDLAYDGTYFYGSDTGKHIWQMDFDTQTLINTIPCPGTVRSIAYDEDYDAFWVNDYDTNLELVDRSGNVLRTIYESTNIYGTAYDNISEGGPYLWIFTGTYSGMGCQIEQYDLNTLTLTGVNHSVSGDFPGTVAGGLFTANIMNRWVLGGLAQSNPDIMFAYEICPWLKIEPTSGYVLPGDYEEVTVTFDATCKSVGSILNANIHFIPNVGNEDNVSVQLIVDRPPIGTLDGYVRKVSDLAPIEGAIVKATSMGKLEYQDTTNSDGYYIIPEIWEDIYDINCFITEYDIPATQTAVIEGNKTTRVNFNLTQPTMDITPTSISEIVPPNEPLAVDIHIVNNGDSKLAWNASIINSTKGVETDYSNCTSGILHAKNGQGNGGNGSNGFVEEKNSKDDVTLHYDGPSEECIGLVNGGTFMAATRFTPTELSDYYGNYQLSNVEIFIDDMPSRATLKVWEGGNVGNPGTEIYSEDISVQISQDRWTTITLSTPIDLVSDNEYWVGYEVSHIADAYPAGCDGGPAVDEKGDWIYRNGEWDELQYLGTYQFNFNWNIRAVLSIGITPWITLQHNSGIVEAGGDSTLTVYLNTIDHAMGETLWANIVFASNPDVGTSSIPVTVSIDSVGVSDESEVIVTELYGNFPNPFGNSTTFKFALKEASHVKLSVYNIKGQLVSRVVDEDMVPGFHEIPWSATNGSKKLANGIYFNKLETGNKTFLKKMILMK